MLQRTFQFETPSPQEPERTARATALPSAGAQPSPPPLVRPDRQITYDGLAHYDWPAPAHDHDTITVDRIRDDIDGPSHRFVIFCGDTVEVYVGPGRVDVGTVTGISHRNHEVRVFFREGTKDRWVTTSSVYPVPTDLRSQTSDAAAHPQGVAAEVCEPTNGVSKVTPVSDKPDVYTFDEYKKLRGEFANGSLAYSAYQAEFTRLSESKSVLLCELKSRFKAPELAIVANRMGAWDAKRSTKDENAEAIYRKMLASFLLDGTVSYEMGERYEDAVTKKVRAVTPAAFRAAFADRQAKVEEHRKALTNPRTLFEFRTFLQEKSEDDLSDEQLARYDALHAEATRERRTSDLPQTISQFQSEELCGHEFQIKEGFHDRRQCKLWIVQLTNRVERATFNELNIKAKMLGGWYSSFRKSDSGFQFLEHEKAERFTALFHGDADRSDVLEVRKERKEQTAAERLHDLADGLTSRAQEAIEQSDHALQNTARRADIQAGVRGRAFADQALARTIHSIAEALSRGKAAFLDGIRHKTQIETLDMLLRVSLFARLRHDPHSNADSGLQPQLLDIRYAIYPYPMIYRNHLTRAIAHGKSARGAKQAAARMVNYLQPENAEYITFRREHDVEMLEEFIGKLKQTGYDTELFGWALEKYRRLHRANITDIHELRTALREYLEHRAEARGDDPAKVAERELIGKKLPGFFPTPRPVIDKMLALAAVEPQHRVLEPSCGKGDIVQAITAACPDASIHAIEVNHTLSEVLSAKGLTVEFADFLEHHGQYDRIVMNPPFENSADIEHIRHAFEQLAPGGRLVSVVSEGPFFRADHRAVAFRHWLESVAATIEPLPHDAFKGVTAFRETGVRTRLIAISR